MNISLTLGRIRKLTSEEKKHHPHFVYVVCTNCHCTINGYNITVPHGFLTDGSTCSPDVGWAWLFHDYLYATHKFDDGTMCSRQLADWIMYELLKYERHTIYAWLLKRASTIGTCIFQREWINSGRHGPQLLSLEECE